MIATLPESDDIKNIKPDSLVTIQLKTQDQSNTLYIKQSLASGLEAAIDEDALKSCKSLEEYGIKPLDLQISLLAPTVLSRNTLDNAESVIKILSMILGFDVLNPNSLGSVVSSKGNIISILNLRTPINLIENCFPVF